MSEIEVEQVHSNTWLCRKDAIGSWSYSMHYIIVCSRRGRDHSASTWTHCTREVPEEKVKGEERVKDRKRESGGTHMLRAPVCRRIDSYLWQACSWHSLEKMFTNFVPRHQNAYMLKKVCEKATGLWVTKFISCTVYLTYVFSRKFR